MEKNERRYDIDWLRVIAIALLIIYHVAIGFQSWGLMIGFITNKESWISLWIPMSLLNIWRIPLLFFVSGMGVYFALQKRNWIGLIKERTQRILLPFIFGTFFIVPLHLLLLQNYYSWTLSYSPNPSHLWFLGNIFSYTILLLPVFLYFRSHNNGKVINIIKHVFNTPLGLVLVMGCFIGEAMMVKPNPYELYAMTVHGYILGFLAFFFGYIFILCGKPFWSLLLRWKWGFLVSGLTLYFFRVYQGQMPLYLLSVESNLWVFCVFAFGYKHLNYKSNALIYLSQSAYPVYIVHMMFLYAASYVIFPLDVGVILKFILVATLTFVGSLGFYEFIIKRVAWMRPLFGLKKQKKDSLEPINSHSQ